MSDAAWTVVQELKESTIALFKNTSKFIPADPNTDVYVAILLKHVSELGLNPFDAV